MYGSGVSGPVSGRVYRSVPRGDGLHANQLTTRLPLNNHRPQIRSDEAIERCERAERERDAAVHRDVVWMVVTGHVLCPSVHP